MPKLGVLLLSASLLFLPSCSRQRAADTLVMIIESSPANLDPRVGLDAQSERIDELLFDALLRRDQHFDLHPWLAERWETPDRLTYVFHLRRGVHFHDGRPLTARDVKWTFDSMLQGRIRTAKAATYRYVLAIETRGDFTVVFHLKQPFASLLWNLSDAAIGIVPYGSGAEMASRPVGSGPFRLVRAEADREVVIERNPLYWGVQPKLARVRFAIVPDTTTRALELRNGSADALINALTSDMVVAMRQAKGVQVMTAPGTICAYIALNLRDPVLKDVRVRQALAYAIDRRPMIHYLWRDLAQPASGVLPPQSWAYNDEVQKYDFDPDRARRLLDEAGYPLRGGARFHLTMKSSTEENTRLMAAVLQQQLRAVGIALDIRTFEFATFFGDITRGAFQIYSLRWIGGNEDPDILDYVFHSDRFPPNGANRSFYSNPQVDRLLDQARQESDQSARKALYAEIQRILARELPYINLWYVDNVLVHSPRVVNLQLNPSGNYDFLRTAELAN